MKAFRAAQVVRKRMRTDRTEIIRSGYLPEPSRQLDPLRQAGIVAAYSPAGKYRRDLIPPDAKLPRGRPKIWLTLAAELGYLIGVDIAHQEVSVSITRANFGGVLKKVRSVPVNRLDESPEEAIGVAAAQIRLLIAELAETDGLEPSQVIGIGVGLPGPVARLTKTIAPELHILSAWSNHQPTEELGQALADILPDVPIEVDNDASLGALGIYSYLTLAPRKGASVPRDLLYVRVSDGIGAGVVIKGKLVGGGSGFAGEIGHVKVDDRGHFCPRCGQRGCVETKASERAVLAELAPTVFAHLERQVTIEDVLASTHPACFRSLHEAGWHLGAALAHARTLLDPTRIYVGGPMAGSPHFLSGVRLGILRNSLNHSLSPEKEVAEAVVRSPSELPGNRPDIGSAELMGAIAMALHRCGDAFIERRLRDFQAQ